MSDDELTDTYQTHVELLEGLFNRFSNKASHRVLLATDYDFVVLLDELLTGDQKSAMINRLHKELRDEKEHGISRDVKLFWEVMLPEW